ncbi:AMP-binding protein [Amycolatopsis sp. NPDC006125]|uniref:AMP-binding protein n=1 Tax=Amycolatopsis sp. NPDC006125 TaxID=3156730 RepID=UPI0033AECD32
MTSASSRTPLVDAVRTDLPSLLRKRAAAQPEQVFVESFDGTTWTYREVWDKAAAVAGWLSAAGCGKGDRVVCVTGNRPEILAVLFGANLIGAIFVPLNPELKGQFLGHQLANSEPAVVFVQADLLETVRDAGLPGSVREVVVFGEPRWDEVVAHAPIAEPAELAPSDISTILYTSGTTGPAKGVLLPHAHCVLFGAGIATHLRMTPADKEYVALPLFHANGLFMQVGAVLFAGAQFYLAKRFSASGWLPDVRRTGATITHLLGVMADFVLNQPPSDADLDHGLRAVLSIPVSDEGAPEFERRFGVEVLHGFGMTECNMVAYSTSGRNSGKALDAFELAIADAETGQLLPAGTVGEIVVRPRIPGAFMAGYFKMPDKTVEAWRDLWFHTGDAGFLDEQSRLHFVDRIKDCIRRRGENISSYEVEQAVLHYPGIAECAAVGVKTDDAGGEDEVMICVVPDPGAEIDPSALTEFCRERMPKHMVPGFVKVMTELPKTATGKLQKAPLRASTNGAADVRRRHAAQPRISA